MTLPDTATRAKAREIAARLREMQVHRTLGNEAADLIDSLLSSGGIDGEPVAWRVRDFGDGWILFRNKETAYAEVNETGSLIEPLYRHPAPREAAEGERLRAALRPVVAYCALLDSIAADDFVPDSYAVSVARPSPDAEIVFSVGDLRRLAALASPVTGSE